MVRIRERKSVIRFSKGLRFYEVVVAWTLFRFRVVSVRVLVEAFDRELRRELTYWRRLKVDKLTGRKAGADALAVLHARLA